MKGKVLFLLSSATIIPLMNGQTLSTGFHTQQIVESILALKQADYEVIIATPDGRTPHADPRTFDIDVLEPLGPYRQILDQTLPLLLPLSFAKLTEELLCHVDGLFIPGGYAVLFDVYRHPQLKHILKHMHDHQKPTASICHGISTLAYPLDTSEEWFYKNYRITCYPKALDLLNEEEKLKEQLPCYVEDLMLHYGATVVLEEPKMGHVVIHKELITGQDAHSTKAVISKMIELLNTFIITRQLPESPSKTETVTSS